MFHSSVTNRLPFHSSSGNPFRITIPPLIVLPFIAGIVLGAFVGIFSDAPQELLSVVGLNSLRDNSISFIKALWFASRFVLLASFFAAGITGVILLPLLSFVRGFSFGCSVAAVIVPASSFTILFTFLSLGLPSLISFPAFLLAETDAFVFSQSLLHYERRAQLRDIPLFFHLFLILLLCTADAVYIRFLLPLLRGLL